MNLKVIKDDNGIKATYYISSDEEKIMYKVKTETDKYIKDYNVSPTIVIMPIGCMSKIDPANAYLLAKGQILSYMGLTVCETPAIKTIDEIEVF